MAAPETADSQTLPHKKVQRNHNNEINGNGTIALPPSSDLPDEVINFIFSFLPIKHAVQFRILNTKFKNSWIYCRRLCFDRDFAPNRPRSELVEIINRIFTHHRGSIQCFKLCIDPVELDFLIKSWIEISIAKRVEVLDLDFSRGSQFFQLCSGLIDIESLKILKLSYCGLLNLPLKLSGSSLLKILVLRKVDLKERFIEGVLSYCLNLEVLELINCYRIFELIILGQKLKKFRALKVRKCDGICWIKIDSPILCSFNYCGDVCNINLGLSTLKEVVLNFTPNYSTQDFINTRLLINRLAAVESLTVTSTFLERLSPNYENGVLREVQFQMEILKDFHLLMESASFCNPYDIASFISKCPKLEKLLIDLGEFNFACGDYWELHAKPRFTQCRRVFKHLKLIKVNGFKFHKHELELMKYLLTRAPSLQTLELATARLFASDAKGREQFLYDWRASPNARIIIHNPRISSEKPQDLVLIKK